MQANMTIKLLLSNIYYLSVFSEDSEDFSSFFSSAFSATSSTSTSISSVLSKNLFKTSLILTSLKDLCFHWGLLSLSINLARIPSKKSESSAKLKIFNE